MSKPDLKCACGHDKKMHYQGGCQEFTNHFAHPPCYCEKFNPVIPVAEVLKAIDDVDKEWQTARDRIVLEKVRRKLGL